MNVNGNYLRKLREEKGMSRAILAERSTEDGGTTIHEITIERMERKPDNKFRPDSVKSVARVLECPQSALTNEADNIVPVVCERIVQGRELYDRLKDAEGVEFDAEVEPSEPEVQQAVLRLVGNAGKIVQGQTGGAFTDVLRWRLRGLQRGNAADARFCEKIWDPVVQVIEGYPPSNDPRYNNLTLYLMQGVQRRAGTRRRGTRTTHPPGRT